MEIFRETPVVFVRRRDNGAICIPRRCVSGIHSSLPLFKTAQLHARCNMMQGKKRRDMERERKKRIIRYSLILNRLWKKCKIIADNSIVASIDERLIIDSKINIFC